MPDFFRPGASGQSSPPESRRWFSPLRLLAVAVSAVVVIALSRRLDRGSLLALLRDAKPEWLLAAVTAQGLALSCSAWRWHQMLRLTGADVNLLTSWRWTLVGHSFSAFLFGAAVSDVAKATLYSRWRGFSVSSILAASVLDRSAGVISTILYALTTLVVARIAGPRLPEFGIAQGPAWRWQVLAIVGVLVAVVVSYWIQRRWLPRLRAFWRELTAMGRSLWLRPRIALLAVGVGLITQLSISLVLACSLRAITSAPLEWISLAWTFPVIGVVASLPVTLSGAGAREGAAMVLWAPFGIAAVSAFGAGLLTLAVNLLWAIGGSGLLWLEAKAAKRVATSSPSSPIAR